jgi:hypothetical protein
MDEILSIEDAFDNLKDPRSRIPLTTMLVVALCEIFAGADSWLGIRSRGGPCGMAQVAKMRRREVLRCQTVETNTVGSRLICRWTTPIVKYC